MLILLQTNSRLTKGNMGMTNNENIRCLLCIQFNKEDYDSLITVNDY